MSAAARGAAGALCFARRTRRARRSLFIADELGRELSSAERAIARLRPPKVASGCLEAGRDRAGARANALADPAAAANASDSSIEHSLAKSVDGKEGTHG